jgi:hypothetical protein
MLRQSGMWIVLTALGLVAACQGRAPGRDWNQFVAGFLETYFQVQPLFAVYRWRSRNECSGSRPSRIPATRDNRPPGALTTRPT